jgi:hypothetical protein
MLNPSDRREKEGSYGAAGEGVKKEKSLHLQQ